MRPAAPTRGLPEYSTALTCSGPSINYQKGYRAMFILHDVRGYEHKEIAEILGCSVGLVLRQRFCRGRTCGKLFWICRHCDRGQRYCGPLCRQQAYRQQRRLANRRHQQSLEGRLDHRDRQRAYRHRRTNARVTDQGSLRSSFRCRILLQVATPTPAQHKSRPRMFFGWLRCIVCGRRGRFIDPYS